MMRICAAVSKGYAMKLEAWHWRTYALDGAEATELALEVLLVGLVTEARDDHGLEGVAADVWVLVRSICESRSAQARL